MSGSQASPVHWNKLITLLQTQNALPADKLSVLQQQAHQLYQEFQAKGYVRQTCRQALSQPLLLWVYFYRTFLQTKVTAGQVPSPYAARQDSAWMLQVDFCFLNARATGLQPSTCGNFLQAMQLLPSIRAQAIHLAPFFDCLFENLYALDSLSMITPDVVHPQLAQAGLTPEEQLHCLIDAAHLLGKAIGFDLEPHTSQFSRIVLSNPHLFRWLHLNEERTGLADGLTQTEMLTPTVQAQLVAQVRALVHQHLTQAGFELLEDPSQDPAKIRQLHKQITKELIAQGYWPLPSHTWGGVGLPRYIGYNHEDDHPLFEYLNAAGEDHAEHAFGMLAPYCFYTGLPINQVPAPTSPPPQPYEPAIQYFQEIFPRIQARFPFDFVRLDYVDHVFDAVAEHDPQVVVADRLTPPIIQETLAQARQQAVWTGALAERMGQDIAAYAQIGFDLILGNDVLSTIHAEYLATHFRLGQQLWQQNQEASRPASILFAVDTHDSGHPKFWTQPLGEVVSARGMKLRHFMARFASAGAARRPKYECMGNQDMSTGLYTANNQAISLQWQGDQEYNQHYHNLEDLYEQFQPLITHGFIQDYHIAAQYAWWFIDRADGVRERLLGVAHLEKKYDKVAHYLQDQEEDQVVEDIWINIRQHYFFEDPAVVRFDIQQGRMLPVGLIRQAKIYIPQLAPYEFQLYWICEYQHTPLIRKLYGEEEH